MADAFPNTILPHRLKSLDVKYDTMIKKFERSSSKQRFNNRSTAQYIYELQWNLMSLAEFTTLQTHYIDRLGAFKSFTYTDSRLSGVITVWFVEDSLKFQKLNHNYGDVTIHIETA